VSRLVVDLDRLANLVDRMALFQAHLARGYDEVTARVHSVQLTWSGAAAEAQASAHARWRAGAAEVHEALGVLRSIASEAHANYAAAVAANRRMWTS
jgi:WXG100 family type VII secretion target